MAYSDSYVKKSSGWYFERLSAFGSVFFRSMFKFGFCFTFLLQGIENTVVTLSEGHSSQIYNVEMDQAKLHLKLLDYLNHDWKSEFYIRSSQQDINFINFTCLTEMEKSDLDIAIHMTYNTGQTVVAFHSPYWMVNKTNRMLQYKADGIHRKHPPNYTKPVLFSFHTNHFFNNNKVCVIFSLTFPL